MPAAGSFRHRLWEFLSGVEASVLADYSDVLRVAEDCQRQSLTVWLTTLNSAVMRKSMLSGSSSLGQPENFCIDGVPIWKLLQKVLPTEVHRVAGADLIPYLCVNLPAHRGPIAFVGEEEAVARASIDALSARYSRNDLLHIPIPDNWNPRDTIADAERDFFTSAKPSVVFVCLSFPKTREWFESRSEFLPPGLYVGVGSGLRVGGGFLKRLPRGLRDKGFEWVGRLAQDPLRLGPRYAADFVFLARLAFELSRPSFRLLGRASR